MKKILQQFEKAIVWALLAMMIIAVFVSAVELGVILIQKLWEPPFLLLDIKEMLDVFGFFLMVLIGLELFESIQAYLDEEKFHVEIVFLVAMVAVARKIIILDIKDLTPMVMFGMSAILVSLSTGYFLIKKTLSTEKGQNRTDFR